MNIVCIQQNNTKSVLINLTDKKHIKLINNDNYCLGYDVDNNLCFINIFDNSFTKEFSVGLIYATEEIIKKINQLTNLKLSNPDKNESKLIVAKIVDLSPIPNSHLNYCDVNIGDQTLKIVCGAANARKDLITVLAVHNTLIPTGVLIKKGKLMNLDSAGMLCSYKELGIDTNKSGIIELNESTAQIGSIFKEVYQNLK